MSLFSETESTSTNVGTAAVRLRPHTEPSSGYVNYQRTVRDQYQTISAQSECLDFSLEELRLVDYKQGKGLLPKALPKGFTMTTSASPFQTEPRLHLNRLGNQHLDLYAAPFPGYQPATKKHRAKADNDVCSLRGPGIELHVGSAPTPQNSRTTNDTTKNTWCLPQRLISHYSPFLKAACSRDFKERRDNRIELPEDDATSFSLFVEWMYYGAYAIESLPSPSPSRLPCVTALDDDAGPSMDAKCWVLGDKLLCPAFKNYAMSRLYARHNDAAFFSQAVTTHDVRYACENSAADSMLRKLYVDFVATHFGDAKRVLGTVHEWDDVLCEYADLRVLLLQGFRSEAAECQFVKGEDGYFEPEARGP